MFKYEVKTFNTMWDLTPIIVMMIQLLWPLFTIGISLSAMLAGAPLWVVPLLIINFFLVVLVNDKLEEMRAEGGGDEYEEGL